jgi:uncharacterized protein (TIGR02246 family)
MVVEPPVKEEIEKLSAALATALNSRNPEAAAALFTDDSFLLPPGRRIVKGKADIETFWTNAASRLREVEIVVNNTKSLSLGVARGIGRLIMAFDGEPSHKVTNKFLFIAERTGEFWKIESLGWSRVAASPPKNVQIGPATQDERSANRDGAYGDVSPLYRN